MKALTLLIAGTALNASAQECTIFVNTFVGTVEILYNGALPIQQLWSDIGVRLSGNGAITILSQSSNYTDLLSPNGAVITGNGTNEVTFVGSAGGPLLHGVHSDDSLWAPFTFSYDGDLASFGFQLIGQNTCTFVQPPFGNPINMQNADGSQGPLSYEIYGPTPGTATLLVFSGIIASRRRRP